LCAATAAYSVLQSVVVPALGVFQHQLRTTPSGAAWILTAFLLSASVSTPVLGRFADLRGKGPVLAAALAAMSAGSLISAAADSLGLMVAGRVVQGLGGAVFPLCFALVRDHVAPALRPRAFVTVSTVMSVSGAAGTVTAGPLLAALSSRWLFILPAVVSALAALSVATLIPSAAPPSPGARVGWRGAALLASWLTLLLLAISMVPTRGWLSPTVLGVAGGAVVLLGLWLTAEVRARHPLVDMATLSMPTVRATNAATLLLGFGTFGSWMLIPLLVAQPAGTGIGFGASPGTVGLVMLPNAVGTLLVMPLNRRLTSRHGPRVALPLGASVAAVAYLLLAVAHGSLAAVCGAVLLMGVGVGLSFAAVASLVVEAVPLAQTAVSAGINTVMRTIGGSLGASVGASLLTASINAAGYPTPRAYTIAILVYAGALAGAAVIASRVPAPLPPLSAVPPSRVDHALVVPRKSHLGDVSPTTPA
jgi:MFS family permease